MIHCYLYDMCIATLDVLYVLAPYGVVHLNDDRLID